MKRNDFPELEKLPITFRDCNGVEGDVVVVGCNYDVGITLTCKQDCVDRETGYNMFCLNGPSSPHYDVNYDDTYEEQFYFIVDQIKNKKVDMEKFNKMFNIGAFFVDDPLSCPYN